MTKSKKKNIISSLHRKYENIKRDILWNFIKNHNNDIDLKYKNEIIFLFKFLKYINKEEESNNNFENFKDLEAGKDKNNLIGLTNDSNIKYFNCIVQILFNSTIFFNFISNFDNDNYLSKISKKNRKTKFNNNWSFINAIKKIFINLEFSKKKSYNCEYLLDILYSIDSNYKNILNSNDINKFIYEFIYTTDCILNYIDKNYTIIDKNMFNGIINKYNKSYDFNNLTLKRENDNLNYYQEDLKLNEGKKINILIKRMPNILNIQINTNNNEGKFKFNFENFFDFSRFEDNNYNRNNLNLKSKILIEQNSFDLYNNNISSLLENLNNSNEKLCNKLSIIKDKLNKNKEIILSSLKSELDKYKETNNILNENFIYKVYAIIICDTHNCSENNKTNYFTFINNNNEWYKFSNGLGTKVEKDLVFNIANGYQKNLYACNWFLINELDSKIKKSYNKNFKYKTDDISNICENIEIDKIISENHTILYENLNNKFEIEKLDETKLYYNIEKDNIYQLNLCNFYHNYLNYVITDKNKYINFINNIYEYNYYVSILKNYNINDIDKYITKILNNKSIENYKLNLENEIYKNIFNDYFIFIKILFYLEKSMDFLNKNKQIDFVKGIKYIIFSNSLKFWNKNFEDIVINKIKKLFLEMFIKIMIKTVFEINSGKLKWISINIISFIQSSIYLSLSINDTYILKIVTKFVNDMYTLFDDELDNNKIFKTAYYDLIDTSCYIIQPLCELEFWNIIKSKKSIEQNLNIIKNEIKTGNINFFKDNLQVRKACLDVEKNINNYIKKSPNFENLVNNIDKYIMPNEIIYYKIMEIIDINVL